MSSFKLLFNRVKNFVSASHSFPDGSKLSTIHRMALRYSDMELSVDIGFEPYGDGLVANKRLIPLWNIVRWNAPHSDRLISIKEKEVIIRKLKIYCDSRRIHCIFEERANEN